MKKKKISMIIPCYNEEKNVELFYNETNKYLSNKDFELEMIYINDGSKDNTIGELNKLLKKHDKGIFIKIINFSRNFGKESALYAGLKESTGDYVVIIDADLQQHPKLILPMYEHLENNENDDCVAYFQEKRIEGKVMTFLKKNFYKIISKMCGINFVNGASDFRMLRRYVVDGLLQLEEYNRFSKGIFSWIGYNTYYIPYVPDERANGVSSFNTIKLFKYAWSGIIAFSIAPLKLATYLGTSFSLISFIYLIVVVIQKLCYGISIPGYATLICFILLIGGVILVCLGIIGEYIARIYLETKKRPVYLTKYIRTNEK